MLRYISIGKVRICHPNFTKHGRDEWVLYVWLPDIWKRERKSPALTSSIYIHLSPWISYVYSKVNYDGKKGESVVMMKANAGAGQHNTHAHTLKVAFERRSPQKWQRRGSQRRTLAKRDQAVYLFPCSRLYWPLYLDLAPASSIISGTLLANKAYKETSAVNRMHYD